MFEIHYGAALTGILKNDDDKSRNEESFLYGSWKDVGK